MFTCTMNYTLREMTQINTQSVMIILFPVSAVSRNLNSGLWR